MDKQKLFKYINERKGFVTFLILFVIPLIKFSLHYFISPSKHLVKYKRRVRVGSSDSYWESYDFSEHFNLLFDDKLFLFIPSIIIVILVIWNFSNKIDKLLYYFKDFSFSLSLQKISQSKANNVSPKWTVMFFKSKYFETFYTFYISWFFLTFIDKIIIPIIKGATLQI